MNINIKEVEHVAELARLNLSEEEKQLYTRQFNVILEHIDKFNELDLEKVEPTTYVQPLKNVLRADMAVSSEKKLLEEVLKQAPDREGGLFKVPPVLE